VELEAAAARAPGQAGGSALSFPFQPRGEYTFRVSGACRKLFRPARPICRCKIITRAYRITDMLRTLRTPLAVLMLLAAGLPIQAADTALDAVTQEASLVIRLKKPKASVDKIAEMVDLIVPGQGDEIRNQKEFLGQAISNPNLAGVDMETDWYVAMYTDEAENSKAGNDEPAFLFIVPATDLKAMKEALGDSFKFVEHGKLGVYTSDDETFKATTARLKGEGKSISTLIDKDSNTVFESGDVSVFINVKQLVIDYRDEIAEFKEKAKQQIENLPAGAAGGVDPAQITGIANQVIKFVSEGLDDATSCTVAAVISKEGLAFEDLVKVKSGSATDKLLAKSPAGALAALNLLPAGHLAYYGLSWDTSDFAKLNQWLRGIGGAALEPEVSKELDSIMAETGKLKISSKVGAFGLGDSDEGAVRTVSITEIDNPAKMRELTQKALKVMEKMDVPGVKQTYDYKKDSEKYGKNSADVITVKTEFGEGDGNPFAEMIGRAMTMLFGAEGATTRAVFLKDRIIETMGGGKQAMTDALAAQEQKTSSTKPAFQQARGKLTAKSNLVFLLDLPNTIAKIVEVVVQAQILGPVLPIDADQVKELQSKPSYFGLSAGTEAQALRVKTVIPIEQMQGIAKIVMFVQQLRGQFGQ
jgi:hypothetical protein